ncbi:MAG: hypothetical protein KME27_21675 [Lyngbya sp. HA4199-MV5]|jgi:hypothetical protein|nr:hypothetical protein [Lyngbya sp. HA4199-MV5]
MEDIHQQFAITTPTQKAELLAEALNAGDTGIDLLIEALNDETLSVRATAYKLLQSVSTEKAQRAIANGVLLNPGDRIYSVYQSAISYNDEFYKFETTVWERSTDLEEALKDEGLNWEEMGYDSYEDFCADYKAEYESHAPQRIFRSVDRNEAESVVQKIHQCELLNWHILDFNIPPRRNPNFNLESWCKANNMLYQDGWINELEFAEILRLRYIEDFKSGKQNSEAQKTILKLTEAMHYPFSLIEWCLSNGVPHENSLDDWESILEYLTRTESYELLRKLWNDAVGSFAFVHEEAIREKVYLKNEGNM